MNKRQETILNIIKETPITTQEELAAALTAKGIAATQATVSRDIKKLGLRKQMRGGKSCYVEGMGELSISGAYSSVLRESLIRVDTAMNLLVLKTHPGMGSAVGAAVDALEFTDVVGTIAGDDTIMVALKSVDAALYMQKRFAEFLH